ncbi:TPA: hypothetical protein ACK4X0_001249 [Neisseria gonorrhoeae]|uniref:hypothetical protein n=1 Tax=Neisseria gonorrhoeae TaxID=485 RepID=UPI00030E90AD
MPSENGRRIIVKTYRAPFAVAKITLRDTCRLKTDFIFRATPDYITRHYKTICCFK